MAVSRRKFLTTTGGLALAAGLPSMPAFAQDRSIRHFWWGNPERDRRTFEVIEVFEKNHPGISVSGETIGWGDYWTKMATQTAGRNMADLVQMDYRFLFEYVRRGALQELDPFIGNGLDLSNFDKGPLQGGMVDGKLYALNIGSNSQVFVYNETIFEEAGVADTDVINWTWDQFADVCKTITEATGGKVKGSDDCSVVLEVCEVWIRQNGSSFFGPEGDVTVTPDIIADYWQFWRDLRDAGVLRSADKSLDANLPMSDVGIVAGDTAISNFWSNQIVGVQALMQDPVGAAMVPHKEGGDPGQFIKPSMFMSLTRDSEDPEAAIMYMNDWINNPEETKILGLERGIPANPDVRAALAPDFTPAEKVSVDYFNAIQDKVGPLPPPEPKGAGEVRDAFIRAATNVVLGDIAPQQAAEVFVDDAQAIVDRAR
ncbi:carbohydrate ABC transporter substrate-binding protein [Martelella lutilitoris]|uniref:Carbohydrate ABC transporter substrate-binding protein n=1 Tax=Martelella lutilitoris TaxID=2583532 RepID=A0A5C4JSN6_9HYPH|nr:ABC transporter substrate-binding protein [Martelella lutilitoris]TNB48423.1 carbohydrate ABC transporter substrate-binding protein [Martelella lutilitoris]